MGIQGMQSSLKNNKRDRKSIFDDKKEKANATYSKFENSKKMTEYEFHEFQKKIKKENSLRQNKILIYSSISILGVILLVIYLLFFMKV